MTMISARRLRRLARPGARRILGALVFALQAVLAGSALWEPRVELKLGLHTEQDGTRHVDSHNEATCIICSARAQSSLPTLPEPTLDAPRLAIAIAPKTYTAAAFAEASPLHARAPPSVQS